MYDLRDDKLPNYCNGCACWNTASVLLEITPPKQFPKSEIPSSNALGPITIYFPAISRAIDMAIAGLIYEDWTEIEAKKYLNRYCPHDKLEEGLLAYAKESQQKLAIQITMFFYPLGTNLIHIRTLVDEFLTSILPLLNTVFVFFKTLLMEHCLLLPKRSTLILFHVSRNGLSLK
jgi:hypothetical protein